MVWHHGNLSHEKLLPHSLLAETVGAVERALDLGLNYGSGTHSDLTRARLDVSVVALPFANSTVWCLSLGVAVRMK